MATKWKRNRQIIGIILFVISISVFIFNGITLYGAFFERTRWGGKKTEFLVEDYQSTDAFQQFVEQRLGSFLSMGVGKGIDGIYCDNYDDYAYEEYNENGDEVTYTKVVTDTYEEAEAYEGTDSNYDEINSDMEIPAKDRERLIAKFAERIERDKNLLFRISYEGKVLYTNMEQVAWQKVGDALPENYNYVLHYQNGSVEMQKDGKAINIYGDGIYREDGGWYVPGYQNFTVDEEVKKVDVVMMAAKTPLLYTQAKKTNFGIHGYYQNLYDISYNNKRHIKDCKQALLLVEVSIVCVILSLLLWRGKKETHKKTGAILAKIPLEVKLIFLLIVTISFAMEWRYLYDYCYEWEYYGIYSVEDFGWGISNLLEDIVKSSWMVVFVFWYIYLLIIDISQNRNILKNSACYKLVQTMRLKMLHLSFAKKWMRRTRLLFVIQTVLSVVAMLIIIAAMQNSCDGMAIAGPIFLIWLCIFVASGYLFSRDTKKQALALDTLANQIQEIKDGKEKIDTDALVIQELGSMSENLNEIHEGMEVAIEERMKSERMKVALLTNISHDIKTPLTSIISYVDLMKEEESLPEHVKDYVRILEQKSLRLKSMINDVFEVSKATAGQLPVMMETLDFGKLLEQTMADMQEQIDRSTVQVKLQIPEQRVMVQADGKRMYRVFQNLIQNALKYSLDGSRVYLTLVVEEKDAIASISSTSKDELNQNIDFTERFVRGDASRTDGGNGLGLSIAKSFTEACEGEFEIATHADLFVAKVRFQIVTPEK